MTAVTKRKADRIKVRQFLIDTKGHKIAAVIDIDEPRRLETVLDLFLLQKNGRIRTKRPLMCSAGPETDG